MISQWTMVASILGLLLAALLTLSRMRKLHPELRRKSMHMITCAVALSFPWLFDDHLPVIVISTAATIVLIMMRVLPVARELLGACLHQVKRQSWGDIVLPFSIAALFIITADDRMYYVVALLVLGFADSIAALVGTFFGRHLFEAPDGPKSLEGSLGMLVTSFICGTPLFFSDTAGGLQHLVLVLNLALVLTLIEAVSWRGLDNIALPFCTVLLLDHFLLMSIDTLIAHLFILLMLTFVIVLLSRLRLGANHLATLMLGLYLAIAFMHDPALILILIITTGAPYRALYKIVSCKDSIMHQGTQHKQERYHVQGHIADTATYLKRV